MFIYTWKYIRIIYEEYFFRVCVFCFVFFGGGAGGYRFFCGIRTLCTLCLILTVVRTRGSAARRRNAFYTTCMRNPDSNKTCVVGLPWMIWLQLCHDAGDYRCPVLFRPVLSPYVRCETKRAVCTFLFFYRWFEEHHPEQGNFTHESDRDAIRAVLAKQVDGEGTR